MEHDLLGLFPLDRCLARCRVVSGAGELGVPLLSYRGNRVISLQSALTTFDVVTLDNYFPQTE